MTTATGCATRTMLCDWTLREVSDARFMSPTRLAQAAAVVKGGKDGLHMGAPSTIRRAISVASYRISGIEKPVMGLDTRKNWRPKSGSTQRARSARAISSGAPLSETVSTGSPASTHSITVEGELSPRPGNTTSASSSIIRATASSVLRSCRTSAVHPAGSHLRARFRTYSPPCSPSIAVDDP